jgi:hypothetical protein
MKKIQKILAAAFVGIFLALAMSSCSDGKLAPSDRPDQYASRLVNVTLGDAVKALGLEMSDMEIQENMPLTSQMSVGVPYSILRIGDREFETKFLSSPPFDEVTKQEIDIDKNEDRVVTSLQFFYRKKYPDHAAMREDSYQILEELDQLYKDEPEFQPLPLKEEWMPFPYNEADYGAMAINPDSVNPNMTDIAAWEADGWHIRVAKVSYSGGNEEEKKESSELLFVISCFRTEDLSSYYVKGERWKGEPRFT